MSDKIYSDKLIENCVSRLLPSQVLFAMGEKDKVECASIWIRRLEQQLKEDDEQVKSLRVQISIKQNQIDRLIKSNDKYTQQLKQKDELLRDACEVIDELSHLVSYTHNTCLCERFKTEGFDYHEYHPNRDKNNGGCRPLTPKDAIESLIGFTWSDGGYYPKVLKFEKLKKFYSNENIKELKNE